MFTLAKHLRRRYNTQALLRHTGRIGFGVSMNGLIGYTGFVGGNLRRQRQYSALYNSVNVAEMQGQHFRRLVCAGVSAVKWLANKDPEGDWEKIAALIDVLKTVTADQFVLISTIDVYAKTQELDETFDNHGVPHHAYGTHRLKFEDFCRTHFSRCQIVRLPGLFGAGLKKNVIFDLMNDHCLELIAPGSSFQYYGLENLSDDLDKIERTEIPIINLFTEPVFTSEVIERFFPGKIVGTQATPEVHYNLWTKYANLWGKTGCYCYSREEVFAQMEKFIFNR